MRLYLASFDTGEWETIRDYAHLCKNILLSYWYLKGNKNEELLELMLQRNDEERFILDSGAFTMFSAKKEIDLKTYVDDYIKFINHYDIKQFVELDIGIKVGQQKANEIRDYIEQKTRKQSIPVWHFYHDTDHFKMMCKNYDYIAIGGMANGEIKRENFPVLKEMNAYARTQGTKVHGLAFTGKDSYKYGFYSVDSSSWAGGRRFGQAHKFDGESPKAVKKPPNTMANYDLVDKNNLIEWCKFQRHLEGKEIV